MQTFRSFLLLVKDPLDNSVFQNTKLMQGHPASLRTSDHCRHFLDGVNNRMSYARQLTLTAENPLIMGMSPKKEQLHN